MEVERADVRLDETESKIVARASMMHLMRHSDRRLSDHLYPDAPQLPSIGTVQKAYGSTQISITNSPTTFSPGVSNCVRVCPRNGNGESRWKWLQ